MKLPRNQREELTKLRVLRYLSQPLDMDSGAALQSGIRSGLNDLLLEPDGRSRSRSWHDQMGDLNRLLPEMQETGLIGRRQEPDPRDGKSRPYFITDRGRRYLEDAQQRAMLFDPDQRRGWVDREPSIDNHQTLAEFIRQLPEFRGSDEARIQEVTYKLYGLAEKLFQRASPPR
jgi:DNA-binding PadR family transcriptional regulator